MKFVPQLVHLFALRRYISDKKHSIAERYGVFSPGEKELNYIVRFILIDMIVGLLQAIYTSEKIYIERSSVADEEISQVNVGGRGFSFCDMGFEDRV